MAKIFSFLTKATRVASVAAAAAVALAAPDLAMATPNFSTGGQQVLTDSCSMLNRIMDFLFSAVYVLGAIGLVVIAVSAFLGRFKFAHLIALGGGLFIVAAADLLIGFMSGGATTDANCSV